MREGIRSSLDTASCVILIGRHRPEPRIDILSSVYADRAHLSGAVTSFSMAFDQLGQR
jgi:hypothetical protein